MSRLEICGLSVATFSRRQGISPASLDHWRRRLATPGTIGNGNGKRDVDQPLRFVPLALGPALSRFEVRPGSGTSIALPEHFDPGTLLLVLQAWAIRIAHERVLPRTERERTSRVVRWTEPQRQRLTSGDWLNMPTKRNRRCNQRLSDLPLFASDREQRLWTWTLVVVIGIYSTLGLASLLARLLYKQSVTAAIFVTCMLLIGLSILTQGLKARPGSIEIGVGLGTATAYLLLFFRLTLPERSHLMEYGIVAVFIYEALTERKPTVGASRSLPG